MVEIFDMVFIRLRNDLLGPEKKAIEVLILFIDIICCLSITIVVKVYLDERLRLLTKPLKHSQNHRFLLQRGSFHFKNGYENFMEENFNFFLLEV